MKIGISGAVGIGKTWFVEELNNSIFLRIEEAARKVNAMYPDKSMEELRELIFHHQISVEEVVDKFTEDIVAVCDRTVIDNLVFIELFADKEFVKEKKAFVKSAYLNDLRKYDALYYLDYGIKTDPQLLKRTLSDDFRKKTLGQFADLGCFFDFNRKFKDIFLRKAEELGITVEAIETDYDVFSLNNRNQMLQEKIINNFLGV